MMKPTMTRQAWKKLNARRMTLIHKKKRTANEQDELSQLQDATDKYQESIAPFDPVMMKLLRRRYKHFQRTGR